MEKVFIIVPCYNEEETLDIYYDEVIKYLDDKHDFHIVFVNDGSKDKTLDKMKEIAKKDKRFYYISFSRNFGKEAAMYAGLDKANKCNCDIAIIMDVDLQDPPYLLPELLKAHDEGFNLVYTKQKNRHGASKLSAFFSLSFYKVYSFFTKDKLILNGARDYCLLDKKVVKAFLEIKDNKRFTKGIYGYVGFSKKCIEFDYVKRSAGETKWNFKKLFRYAFVGINEFSDFYKYIPKIFAIIFFLLFSYDIGRGIYDAIDTNQNFFEVLKWDRIRFDFLAIAIFITLYYVFKLIYDVRSQSRNRPIYIEEETNIDETE
ncbi:MAG: glycosyltransferase family 2 protein [Acholeplasmatales bacterium]|nr:glycosyltransferase family 2 protein [Acholeplasmatales bacterium]